MNFSLNLILFIHNEVKENTWKRYLEGSLEQTSTWISRLCTNHNSNNFLFAIC